jgi:molecular chaperone DnaK
MAVVGVDLGTTNTVVACARSGRVHVLGDDQGRRLLPSVVSFHADGSVLVGHAARERRAVDAKNTISSVKRLIGRAWNSDEIRRARQRFPFELREGLGQGPLVVARNQTYTLPEISAFVLRRAKQIAEQSLGDAIERAVITVPANFNELQRAATKVAGRIAGLDVMRIINEPTAAALAYGFGRGSKERVAVYDFGGGTFDCTLLELSGNVFEVLATAGDTFLGGDDLDLAIAEQMADALLRAHRVDARADAQVFERLHVAAEPLKIELSTAETATSHVRDVAHGVGGSSLELTFPMTRSAFDALASPLVQRTLAVCEQALSIARLPVAAFDKVILVGGSTRIALVRRRVEEFFGTAPLDRVNPEEVVAIGAAIQASALSEAAQRRSIPPPPAPGPRAPMATIPDDEEATPFIPSVVPFAAARGPAPIAPGRPRLQTIPIPTVVPSNIHVIGEDLPAEPPTLPMLPDSSAVGPLPAAPPPLPRQAQAGPRRPPVLVDVTPLALIVETVGGWSDVIVPRNAKIPCERARAFTTSCDMQTGVRVRVAQGGDALFNKNTFLGEVELVGLTAAPRGQVTIRVRFEVDESGTLKVSATDAATGKEAQAVLQLVGIASAESVTNMQARHAATELR